MLARPTSAPGGASSSQARAKPVRPKSAPGFRPLFASPSASHLLIPVSLAEELTRLQIRPRSSASHRVVRKTAFERMSGSPSHGADSLVQICCENGVFRTKSLRQGFTYTRGSRQKRLEEDSEVDFLLRCSGFDEGFDKSLFGPLRTERSLELVQECQKRALISDPEKLSRLSQELLDGDVALYPKTDEAGEIESVERIVTVDALRLLNDSGRILFRIGLRKKKDGVQAKCLLPGGIRRHADAKPSEALRKRLDMDLGPLVNIIRIVSCEVNSHSSLSDKYGILSTYNRTVHNGRLADGFEDGNLASAFKHIMMDDLGNEDNRNRKRRGSRQERRRLSQGNALEDKRAKEQAAEQGRCTCISLADSGGPVPNIEVFAVHVAITGFYAWLSQKESDHWSSDAGKDELKRWLEHMSKVLDQKQLNLGSAEPSRRRDSTKWNSS